MTSGNDDDNIKANRKALEPRPPNSTPESSVVELYQEFADPLERVLRRRCGSADLAEEILSETFEAVCRKVANGDQGVVTPGWLFTVAQRRLIDDWRRRSSFDKHRHLLRPTPDIDVETLVSNRDAIERALGRMPERQGSALKLKYLHQDSTASVAGQMNLSYSATESLLARARRSFKANFDLSESIPKTASRDVVLR